MKRRILTFMSVFLMIASMLSASDHARDLLFKQGVSAYVAEDYGKAISIFTQIEQSRNVSWELYYNLGNAYYRNHELGNAIRYWEKAKLLAPSQQDIHHNLMIAEQELTDKVVLPDIFPLFKWYMELRQKLPLDLSLWLIGGLLFLMILALGLIRRSEQRDGKHRVRAYITVLSVFITLILILSVVTINTADIRKHEKYAIVLDREVHVLSEPADDATVLFILHEGSKVKVNKKIEDAWSNISYFDDKVGWVKGGSIGGIEE